MTKWEIDDFTPSDRTRVCGVLVDHVAWLRCGPNLSMRVQFTSRGVTTEEARAMIDRMVAGLNNDC